MTFLPVKKRRLHEEIVNSFEQMIRTGSLREGQVLPPERDLVAQFGVGRPALREALLLLQQRGFVEINNGERARVTHPSAERLTEALTSAAIFMLQDEKGVRQFQSLRKIFEVGVVREAAIKRSEQGLYNIASTLAANEAAIDDIVRFGETDVAFHLEIVRTLGNPLLDGMHNALSGWLTEQRQVSLQVANANRRALSFHKSIYQAIASQDGAAAAQAMADHLDEVERFFWKGYHVP